MTDNKTLTKKQVALRILIPAWTLNLIWFIVAVFVYHYTWSHTHWSHGAWEVLAFGAGITKAVLSAVLLFVSLATDDNLSVL